MEYWEQTISWRGVWTEKRWFVEINMYKIQCAPVKLWCSCRAVVYCTVKMSCVWIPSRLLATNQGSQLFAEEKVLLPDQLRKSNKTSWYMFVCKKTPEKGGTKARGVRKRYERRSEDRGRWSRYGRGGARGTRTSLPRRTGQEKCVSDNHVHTPLCNRCAHNGPTSETDR